MTSSAELSDGVLAPGCENDRLFRVFFWLVFAGSLLVYCWAIWAAPLLTHNEARRLVVLREMLASGDWLVPTKNGSVYLQKPPLFTWFGAVFGLLAASTAEWVQRLPSALSGLGVTWVLYFGLKRHIGRWAALLGAAVLVTSYYFATKARLAELNVLLTLCVFAALLCFYEYLGHGRRRNLYLAYAALGLAFMTKGPVALLFFIPPVLLFGLLQKDRQALKGLIDVRCWFLFGVVALPWYLYVNLHLAGFPMLSVIRHEVTAKVVEETHRPEPLYYYVRHLAGAFAPWVLLLLYRPLRSLKQLASNRPGFFFGLAALVPLLIFSLFDYKRDKYILPMYPALAVCFGMMAEQWRVAMTERGRRWATSLLVWGSGVLMILLVGFFSLFQARLVSYRFETLKPLVARIEQLRGESPVYYVGEEPIQLIYYYGRPIPHATAEQLADMQAEGRSFVVLVPKKQIEMANGLKLDVLERVKPYLSRRGVIYILGTPDVADKVDPVAQSR